MSIISETIKLVDAGFTKKDIMAMYGSNKDNISSIYRMVTKEREKQMTKPKEKPEVKPEDNPEPNDSLTSQIGELIKVIQQSNIIKDNQPEPRTIDDIFESMFEDEEDK